MIGWLRPRDALSEAEVNRGLRALLIDGVLGQSMVVLTTGAFLVALALLLGASNKVIGLLAAIGPAAQMLQLPAVFLVDWTRRRKLLVVASCILSRLFLVVIAVIPWFAPKAAQLPLFLGSLFLFFAIGAVSGCAFNSWMRDLVPESLLGRYFSRRMATSIGVGAALSLIAAVGVDLYKTYQPNELGAYTILFLLGAAFGLLDVYFLARVPEPKMAPSTQKGLLAILAQPFRDAKFRQLLFFLGSWNFAVMFAAPFFTVYLLQRLGLSMTWVLGLAVLSQLVNVLFLGIWGRLADRFTNKSCLTVAGPLFMISVVLWPFTTMPERHALTIPLLIVIHVLAGISMSGVLLCAGNIALKAAPRGAATAYLATNALVSGFGAMLAPLAAGLVGDWFATKELGLTFKWINKLPVLKEFQLPALSLAGLDFLFVIAFLLGLYAFHRLLAVKEEGEVEERIVMTELLSQVRRVAKGLSNVADVRALTAFPYAWLKTALSGPPRASDQTQGEPAEENREPPPPASSVPDAPDT